MSGSSPPPPGISQANEAFVPPSGQGDLSGSRVGDFQIERLLGRGGMGDVYLARQISLDRPVAFKVLKPVYASDPASMARFETEAWTAARLNHPHIVHVYALGTDGPIRYIAMEFVPGQTLRAYIDRHGIPPLATALKLMDQATQAVAAAGRSGLVHRDIKPENLLLTSDLEVKVADFGLCRDSGAQSSGLTAPGVTLGTPLYMSPEQVLGRPLDHRSDLYSLGATFYHLLAGMPPFSASTTMALAYKHTSEPPVSLAVHRPDLPPALVELVMRLLQKAPDDRYPSASDLLADLRGVEAKHDAETKTLLPRPRRTLRAGRSPWTLAWALPLAFVAGLAIQRLGIRASKPAPPAALPGLWMEPWETIGQRATALAQYRFAQTGATAEERPAAWLAVVGRFPGTAAADAAYVQFVRELARRGDSWRLDRLAEELSRRHATDPKETWQALGRLARAGAAAGRGDVDGLLNPFREWANLELIDPSHAEVGLEMIAQIRRSTPVQGIQAGALNKLVSDLVGALQIPASTRVFLDPPKPPNGG
jgi:serine/threonine-protein kinase